MITSIASVQIVLCTIQCFHGLRVLCVLRGQIDVGPDLSLCASRTLQRVDSVIPVFWLVVEQHVLSVLCVVVL